MHKKDNWLKAAEIRILAKLLKVNLAHTIKSNVITLQ